MLLVRHTEVAHAWRGRCYGQSDMGLSREGLRHARTLAAALAREPVTAIVHSALRRTRVLADLLSRATGLMPTVDPRWRERDFGDWEGRSWNAIWRATGNAMDGMMTDPHGFRPGGAETGAELAARCIDAWHALPTDGLVVVVAHGGSIGTLRAVASGAALDDVLRFVPELGEIVRVPRLAHDHQPTDANATPAYA